MAAIVDRVLERLIERFKPLDQVDRQGLIALYERHLAEQQEYINAINARPSVAERVDVRRLDRPWQQLERHPSAIPETPAEARNKLINKRITHSGNGSAS
jgi:hypothetical protein